MVRLKYCGNRSAGDVQAALASGADYLGFIFAESRRNVSPEEVKRWLAPASLGDKQLVGVFVNASVDRITAIALQLPLHVIQCHGRETPAELAAVKEAARRAVWKAIHHGDGALEAMKQYAGVADGYVVDSRVAGAWGGTGVSFDWEAVPHYLEEAARQGVPCFIAGGITPDNVERLLAYRPDGIDISSGIETDGRKDPAKMKQIEEKVKQYFK
ncbi:N-(5'-phosphoribosyl)anthranilate isomerase [Geobacillus sp. 46C-IIa]|uniref:phosphoribosylanthranilate isomerase n=1 Tax=Geobacillus sp. 46C-IIa TaxID=1963025 RepID=UPI0009BF037E|nr:phosphoribosylanthranilate isomerase [Geobacillus sp. 46C-IIa]OQP05918.1 N-(5'-phosphoribosyl)anthranilate isomerase [Geobacillus sp. 46C-IIa]QNU29068.1 phosphoribosylanthranilate isomerase [Geobacillus sp. 46C-IIa]